MQSPNRQQKKPSSSYLPSHPQIISKKLPSPLSNSKIPKLQIPQHQYTRIYNQLFNKQKTYSQQLQQKLSILQNENQIFQQSLEYYEPEVGLEQLKQQLQTIKEEDSKITEMIRNCQSIQMNTTPEEYFLFKKNKRLQSFNQAMDQLFQQVNRQKQQMNKFLSQIRIQTKHIKNQIHSVQSKLNKSTPNSILVQQPNGRSNQTTHKNKSLQNNSQSQPNQQLPTQQQQSHINFSIKSNNQSNTSNKHKQIQQYQQSDSGSSVNYQQINLIRQQYKQLLETFQYLSENKQILTTQLFNNITSIEESLMTYYETEKTRLFKDITQIKQDFQSMPPEQIVPPNQTQLKYQIAPLIHDYKNKITQIYKKIPQDLKQLSSQILTPLRWQSINFQSYLQPSTIQNKSRRSTIMSNSKFIIEENNKAKQSQKQYQKIEGLIEKQIQEIYSLEENINQVMTQTMGYLERQNQLELATNNMRKMLREQRQRG